MEMMGGEFIPVVITGQKVSVYISEGEQHISGPRGSSAGGPLVFCVFSMQLPLRLIAIEKIHSIGSKANLHMATT